MRRDQAILVEGILRDFPRINSDRVLREQWLEIMAVSPGGSFERVDGGSMHPVQERYFMAMDEPFLKKLQHVVKTLYESYSNLNKTEQRVVSLSYFDNLDNSSVGAEINANYRYVQRIKSSGLEKMRHACVSVFSEVEEWRDREYDELSKRLSLLSVT